ncbi:uncharacterized protein LOC110029048 isoform X2 [Phalaenopsis equestris]|uniref:uncharacterized protein LOC110029048 isoform X2 n=1 Tax=Phalaenopsis equestris TaxID=78828 RepID=UPI0009E4F48C|nr:uncharacterized protein LOC110029048 isoform X2 [Phalaenopsis equestris]
MPNASKELLDHVERPSLLDDLLLCRKDPPPLPEHKHQNYVKQKERPLISPLPKSQVIGKVEEFLEVMAKANQDLELRAQENPSSNYDIEVLNDDEDKFIQICFWALRIFVAMKPSRRPKRRCVVFGRRFRRRALILPTVMIVMLMKTVRVLNVRVGL